MTRDEIIRMALDCGATQNPAYDYDEVKMSPEALERFANMVAAAEREACAKVCDYYATAIDLRGNEYIRSGDCKRAAELIRDRK